MWHEIPLPVWVFGAGGFARETRWLLEETPAWKFAGFVDVDQEEDFHQTLKNNRNMGYWAVIGIGDPKLQKKVDKEFFGHKNLKWATLIHPSVVVANEASVSFGEGSIVCAGSIFTTDISIGRHNIINLGCTIGHDLRTGDFCVINPNSSTSANVKLVGENLIGVGSSLLANTTVGHKAVLGAGAVLTKDIPAGEVWAGMPARRLEG